MDHVAPRRAPRHNRGHINGRAIDPHRIDPPFRFTVIACCAFKYVRHGGQRATIVGLPHQVQRRTQCCATGARGNPHGCHCRPVHFSAKLIEFSKLQLNRDKVNCPRNGVIAMFLKCQPNPHRGGRMTRAIIYEQAPGQHFAIDAETLHKQPELPCGCIGISGLCLVDVPAGHCNLHHDAGCQSKGRWRDCAASCPEIGRQFQKTARNGLSLARIRLIPARCGSCRVRRIQSPPT